MLVHRPVWDVLQELNLVVGELVRRIKADELKAVAALEKVKEDMTTAISSLEYVQTAIKSNNPPMAKILIDLDMTEQLVMRLGEELLYHAPIFTIDGRVATQELPFTPVGVESFCSKPTMSVPDYSQADMNPWVELNNDALISPAPP